jgi:two-component system KDP operon response regulator KdpE
VKHFTILVVDDDDRIVLFLGSRLREAGYNFVTARDGFEALEKLRKVQVDLVLLDLMMPGMDGLETIRELRTFSDIPVIFLTAKGSDQDKIRGLKIGADDYLAKPFNVEELLARVEAVRRRTRPPELRKTLGVMEWGKVKADFENQLLWVDGKLQALTNIEWMLLTSFAQNLGKYLSYRDILVTVWGSEYRDDLQLLRTWMSRLRNKLGEEKNNPKLIHTVQKMGYILDPSKESD